MFVSCHVFLPVRCKIFSCSTYNFASLFGLARPPFDLSSLSSSHRFCAAVSQIEGTDTRTSSGACIVYNPPIPTYLSLFVTLSRRPVFPLKPHFHGNARDLMPTAMADILGESHADSFLLERRFWVTGGFLLAAPLAFSRTLGALR